MLLLLPLISINILAEDHVINKNGNENTQFINEEDLTVIIYRAPLFLGVNMDITNEGESTVSDIQWSFRVKPVITGAGLVRQSIINRGNLDELAPGETVTLTFRPGLSDTRVPIGFGNMYMNASVQYSNVTVRTQQQAMLLLFFYLGYKDTYMDISPATAYSLWQNETFDLIIDVVGLDIYELGHLPGAVNWVWADGTLNENIPTLDKNGTYLVYCHTDPPSTASAQALINADIKNVYRLEGNYAAWNDAGYPIET
jgi:rhodanese-related sulfurtransferase